MLRTYLLVFGLFFCVFTASAQAGLFMRTIFWGSQLEISWLFFPGGNKVVRNPKYGVNPLNLQKEMAENSNNVGSYTLSGSKMNVKWGDGKAYTINVEFKNGLLAGFDGGVCSKATPFKFRYFDNKTYSGFATFGNISRSIVLFLGKDGRFNTERVGAVSGSGNLTGVAAAKANDGGTYSITGNTIVFKYANGSEWRALAQPYDLGNDEIIINDQLFKLKN